jgi:hypothetical protein
VVDRLKGETETVIKNAITIAMHDYDSRRHDHHHEDVMTIKTAIIVAPARQIRSCEVPYQPRNARAEAQIAPLVRGSENTRNDYPLAHLKDILMRIKIIKV